jgi:hypothetical protein
MIPHELEIVANGALIDAQDARRLALPASRRQ